MYILVSELPKDTVTSLKTWQGTGGLKLHKFGHGITDC